MNASIAFDYAPTYRGPRGQGFYQAVIDTHAALNKNLSHHTGRAFLELVKWRSFQRIASMAGPLVTKYVVKHDKPRLIRSELQRVEAQARGVAVPPPAPAGGGAGKGASKGFTGASQGILSRFFTPAPRPGYGSTTSLMGSSADLLKKTLG